MNDTEGHGKEKSQSEGESVRTRTDPLSPFQACQGQQRDESKRWGEIVKLTHASQDVDGASKTNTNMTTVRADGRSKSGGEIGGMGGEGGRTRHDSGSL